MDSKCSTFTLEVLDTLGIKDYMPDGIELSESEDFCIPPPPNFSDDYLEHEACEDNICIQGKSSEKNSCFDSSTSSVCVNEKHNYIDDSILKCSPDDCELPVNQITVSYADVSEFDPYETSLPKATTCVLDSSTSPKSVQNKTSEISYSSHISSRGLKNECISQNQSVDKVSQKNENKADLDHSTLQPDYSSLRFQKKKKFDRHFSLRSVFKRDHNVYSVSKLDQPELSGDTSEVSLIPSSKIPGKQFWKAGKINSLSRSMKRSLSLLEKGNSSLFYENAESAFKGYLYKGSFSKKNAELFWCTYETDKLSYFLEKRNVIPKGFVPFATLLSLTKAEVIQNYQGHDIHLFKLFTDDDIGVYEFGALSATDLGEWVSRIIGNFIPLFMCNHHFQKAGKLWIKETVSGRWQRCWMILLDNRKLESFSADEEHSSAIDLRKIARMSVQSSDEPVSCPIVKSNGTVLCVDLCDKTIYLQSESVKDLEDWLQIIDNNWKDCGAYLSNQLLTTEDVPVIVDKCIKFISTNGTYSEGIYRKNGVKSKIKILLDSLVKDPWGTHLLKDNYTEHDVAGALRKYFRSLPDPLLTNELHRKFCSNTNIEELEERVDAYKRLIKCLPPVNLATLKKLLSHLYSISNVCDKNRMSIPNLAQIWGPTLLSVDGDGPPELSFTNAEIDVVSDLIQFYRWLFDINPEELNKEKVIQEKIEELTEGKVLAKSSGDFKLWVYIYSREWGKCHNSQISPTTTAKSLCEELKKAHELPEDVQDITMHEVICQGQLERPFSHTETLLPALVKWTSWPDEKCKDNYLVLKKNEIFHAISQHVKPPRSVIGELKYTDNKTKTFRRTIFELEDGILIMYKDPKGTIISRRWFLSDISWYIGIENKREPPTPWNVSFFEKFGCDKKGKTKMLGYCLNFSSEDEYHRWIYAMLTASSLKQ